MTIPQATSPTAPAVPDAPPPTTRIVAIETSGRIGSVAVACGPTLLAQRVFREPMGHAAELMPAMSDLCHQQGWSGRDIQAVYLSIGPGSFTGLRIAVSVAKALHLATGCRIVAVPTVDVLAYNAHTQGLHVMVLLDAKRGMVYAARYAPATLCPGDQTPAGVAVGNLIRTSGPELADPAAYIAQSPRPLGLLGEAIDYHRSAINPLLAKDVVEFDRVLWPGSAAAVHALGWPLAQRGQYALPTALTPIYIRPPEAQEVWERRHAAAITTTSTEGAMAAPNPKAEPTQ
ncbi:MAG: tRNA (adenosine(37)-N6)-threonylcarbamoyltransferase complex dimerization subunit type 1 TsaB [Phycisphaerae bacterium]